MAEIFEVKVGLGALQFPEMSGAMQYRLGVIKDTQADDVVPRALFRELRDELCLHCGKYTEQHLGACDGCKWRDDNE